MLACIPDPVWICSVLCQQPSDRHAVSRYPVRWISTDAFSEFIGTCVSDDIVTLLDINNTVPYDLYNEDIKGKFDYSSTDVFMGFHCGNTSSKKLSFCQMKYQLIMARSLPEEVTQGTLEGDITPGEHHILPSAEHCG